MLSSTKERTRAGIKNHPDVRSLHDSNGGWAGSTSLALLEESKRHTRPMDALWLPRGGSCMLTPPQGSSFARLVVFRGYLRLSTALELPTRDVTIAMTGTGQPQLLRLNTSQPFLLEAFTDAEFKLTHTSDTQCEQELTTTWLLHFSMIRHHLGSAERINQLLSLLAEHFGISTPAGISIPFSLPHTRIAEIIGSTRSTVTRHLGRLKQQGLLLDDDYESSVVLKSLRTMI